GHRAAGRRRGGGRRGRGRRRGGRGAATGPGGRRGGGRRDRARGGGWRRGGMGRAPAQHDSPDQRGHHRPRAPPHVQKSSGRIESRKFLNSPTSSSGFASSTS